jgi:histidine triad (HIT) family protein
MATVQIVSKKIETVLNPDSITIGINHKEKRGVPHLHIHLIPRWDNDNGHALQGVVKNPPKEELPAMAEKLKSA